MKTHHTDFEYYSIKKYIIQSFNTSKSELRNIPSIAVSELTIFAFSPRINITICR